MGISTETIGKWLAEGRNYGSTIVGFIGGVGVISASQQKGFTDAMSEIFNGLGMVFHGAASFWQILIVAFPFIGVALAKWAKNTASVDNQTKAVVAAIKDPNTEIKPEVKATVLEAATEVKKI